MKRLLSIIVALTVGTAIANAAALKTYQPGYRTIDGSQLNLMVAAVNNITGNGTPGAITGTTGVFSSTLSSTAHTITSAGTSCLAVGPNGATNPGLRVDCSTASAATGITITGAAAAGGVAVVARSSGTNENLTIDAKGSGTTTINGTATGGVLIGRVASLTTLNGHVASVTATAPALTSCGTSPTIVGSDAAGTVTMGTASPTGCVITFATAYTAAPSCTVSWQATPLASQSYSVSTTAITLVQTGTSSNLVNYTCVARSGG